MEDITSPTRSMPIVRTFLLASIGLLVSYLFTKIYSARRVIWNLQKMQMPMPKYNPIFGHLLVLQEKSDKLPKDCTTNTAFLSMAQDFPGGMFYFDLWPFSKPILFATTTSSAQQLATTPLDKPDELNAAFVHLTGGPNLFTMPESVWKRWRSLFNPGFSAGYIQDLVPTIAKETKVFYSILKQHSKSLELFQLETLTLKLTIDVIGAVAIDKRFNYQLQNDPLASLLRSQIEWTSFGTELNPFSRYNPMRPLILWYNSRQIDQYIHSEIEKRFQELKNGNISASQPFTSKSIISLALRDYMKEKGLEETSHVDPEFRDIAAAQLRLFLFAGHDTTSSTLVYCYHLLSTHPECLKQIRDEHDAVFGTERSQIYQMLVRDPHLINQLPYTMAVMKEALRLFPPASGFRAGQPGIEIIGDDGRKYPTEGCNVWAMHLMIQRNPIYWKDPHSFLPERWLVGPDDPLYPVKGAWRPFEFGPRNCLGQTLAIAEIKVVLAMTIRDFNIEPAYDQWDKEQKATHIRTVFGNRAYQVEGGGGGAHAADKYPCTVSFRK